MTGPQSGSRSVTHTNTDDMDERSSRRFLLSDAPRTGGFLLGLAYGAGLLIVNLRLSDFGIAEFSFLRPHILAAGSLFLLLVFIPCVASSRIYALLGLKSLTVRDTRPIEHFRWWNVHRSFLFYQVCVGLALVTRFVLTDELFSPVRDFRLLAVPATAGFAIGLLAFDNLIWPTFDTFIWPTLG